MSDRARSRGRSNDAIGRADADLDRILEDPHWTPPSGSQEAQRDWARSSIEELAKVAGIEPPPPTPAEKTATPEGVSERDEGDSSPRSDNDVPAEIPGDDIVLGESEGDDGRDPLEDLFPDAGDAGDGPDT